VADGSSIEWTQATWNPTTGCDKVSAGCDNCYALTLAKRLKAMGAEKYQNDGDPRTSGPGFGITVHSDALDLPYTWRTPRLVFVNSMSDLFHARVPLAFIRQVLQVMQDTPQHTYQVLTKRSRRLLHLEVEWPPNLWMGVSVENARVLARVDDLRRVPAVVRSVDRTTADLPEGVNFRDSDVAEGVGVAWMVAVATWFVTWLAWSWPVSVGWSSGPARCPGGRSRMRAGSR
jgi:protein gp37